MGHWIVGAALAALTGVLISLINHRLSLMMLKKNPNMLAMMSMPRQVINIAYLLAVYFLAPMTPWDRVPLLVGAVVGLTGSMFFFTHALLKSMKQSGSAEQADQPKNHGGDENG